MHATFLRLSPCFYIVTAWQLARREQAHRSGRCATVRRLCMAALAPAHMPPARVARVACRPHAGSRCRPHATARQAGRRRRAGASSGCSCAAGQRRRRPPHQHPPAACWGSGQPGQLSDHSVAPHAARQLAKALSLHRAAEAQQVAAAQLARSQLSPAGPAHVGMAQRGSGLHCCSTCMACAAAEHA